MCIKKDKYQKNRFKFHLKYIHFFTFIFVRKLSLFVSIQKISVNWNVLNKKKNTYIKRILERIEDFFSLGEYKPGVQCSCAP